MPKYLRLVTITIGHVLRWIFGLCPRKKGRITLGSALMKQGSNSYSLYVILKTLGYDAFYVNGRNSLKDIYFISTSEIIIYDSYITDVSFTFSKGARTLNLWHGYSCKNIEKMINLSPYRQRYSGSLLSRWLFPDFNFEPNALLVPSKEMFDSYLKPAFEYKHSTLVYSEYPRLIDKYFDNKRSLVLWAPTWFEYCLHPGLNDYKKCLRSYALANDMDFVYRPHPNSNDSAEFTNSFYKSMELPELLGHTFLLVTDISSLLFDFVLQNGRFVLLDGVGLNIVREIRGINLNAYSYYQDFTQFDNKDELMQMLNTLSPVSGEVIHKINVLFGVGVGIKGIVGWIKN